MKKKGRKYTDCLIFDIDNLEYINSEDMVISRLEDANTRKVIYLHGGFHLYTKKSGKIRYYGRIDNSGKEVRTLFKAKDEHPLLVFEVNSDLKQKIIDKHSFLKKAHEHLKAANGKILIFGMSFRNDDHILELLAECEAEEIHITFYKPKEYKDFFRMLTDKGYTQLSKRIYPYKITELSRSILWSKAKRGQIEKTILQWTHQRPKKLADSE